MRKYICFYYLIIELRTVFNDLIEMLKMKCSLF